MRILIPRRLATRPVGVLLAAAVVSLACDSGSINAVGPTSTKCAVTVPPSVPPIAAEGGQGTVSVTVAAECVWSVASDAAWISITSPATGQGSGGITFVAADNPTATARRGALIVSDRRVEVLQTAAPCDFSLDRPGATMAADGGEGAVHVTTRPGCGWEAASTAPWLTIVGAPGGAGSGTLHFSVQANDGEVREGRLRIADQVFSISQDGASSTCALTLSKRAHTMSALGGIDTLLVRGSPACAWAATSQAPWIAITSGLAGQGDATITLSVAPNPGPVRVGIVVVGGQTYAITQAAATAANCVFAVPAGQSVGASGGAASIGVTTTPGCEWSAESHVPWISIIAVEHGSGSGVVTLQVTPNTGAQRAGAVTVAGRSHLVTQHAAENPSCAYTLGATQHSASAEGGTAAVDVTSGADCAWTASSTAEWITVTGGATGRGNGRVHLSIAANTGGARNATVTIANQTYTVTQAAAALPCSFGLSALEQNIGALGGPATVSVSARSGCQWTASSEASWITVTSGERGSGDGTVVLTIGANLGGARTGTVRIAEQTFTVRQAAVLQACSYSLGSSSASVAASGGSVDVEMTTQPGCGWTTSSHASWIAVQSGSSGSGSGSIKLLVSANSGPARVGSVTIANQTFTVSQSAPAQACTYSISPETQRAPLLGGSYTVALTTQNGCSWTAISGEPWISVTSSASGSGSSTITYTVSLALLPRTGHITIAGQVLTVNQTSLLP